MRGVGVELDVTGSRVESAKLNSCELVGSRVESTEWELTGPRVGSVESGFRSKVSALKPLLRRGGRIGDIRVLAAGSLSLSSTLLSPDSSEVSHCRCRKR